METSRKIMLLDLAPALHGALAGQLEPAGLLTAQASEAGLVITGAADRPQTPPAIPVLPLSSGRQFRLGSILRLARQMLDEPALYLEAFAVGPYLFQPQDKTLSHENAEDIALTDKEVEILVCLSRYAPEAVSRESLLKNVWRYQEGVDTHTLETHIYRLRQKMEKSAENPEILLTAGKGYRLAFQEK